MRFDFSGDVIEKLIEEMKRTELPVVLFGFGGSVFRMYEELVNAGLRIQYIVDNSEEKQGKKWDDKEVISFEKLKQVCKDCNIIISVSSYEFVDQIKEQIVKDGQFNKIYYFPLYYPFGTKARKMIEKHMKEIELVYSILEDEESKKCYENKINYILTKKEEYLNSNSIYREYFPLDIFDFEEKEFFVDAGSFHGEDTIALMEYVNNVKATCFEPDKSNYDILVDNMKEYTDISTVNAAVWKGEEVLSFAESGTMGSTVSKNGEVEIQGVAIDNIVKDKVTFIKMDVEGAEIEAMNGAKRIISTNRPKLAICLYHTIEHHWQIPLLTKKFHPDYRIYMRQHDQTGIETVMYAK